MLISSERDLASVACALIALNEIELTPAEREIWRQARGRPDVVLLESVKSLILAGHDPLGEAFAKIRSPEVRRRLGATYTPQIIVDSMLAWAARHVSPVRIVDPGAGSGRFVIAAAHKFSRAKVLAVEIDPLAALLLRANLAVQALTARVAILVGDYRSVVIPDVDGPTLFIGNPPFVRHHDIPERWKSWFANAAASHGIRASKLAGLHVHFFVRTVQVARSGDFGAYITSAEWLDVNYGSTVRQLLAGRLGGCSVHVLDPKAMPFADATTTAAITCFEVGRASDHLSVRHIDSLDQLDGLADSGTEVLRSKALRSSHWSTIVRPGPRPPAGYIELGELCRVHRGQVTGGNAIWIASGEAARNLPRRVLVPAVTRAKELFDAGEALTDTRGLRRVIDLPEDLDEIPDLYRGALAAFLSWAKRSGADSSYIAKHRRAWWAVGLREPAPILCTYMARRPPVFVRNLCEARHLNIAHGLYPREPLSEEVLARLVTYLGAHVRAEHGRTYAGGLTKYEPKELERVPIPNLANLIV